MKIIKPISIINNESVNNVNIVKENNEIIEILKMA